MVIDQCIKLLREASQLPFFMWKHNYLMLRQSLVDDLTTIQSSTDASTATAQTLKAFIELLSNPEPDELSLAKGFVSLDAIFEASGLPDERLQQYSRLVRRFSKRVNQEAAFAKLRTKLQHGSLTEQRAYEQRLFNTEGLDYCLLYYLTYYKTLTDLNAAAAKQDFIDQPTVNFGFGDLPGIQQDFAQDECLEKFILLILDDTTRNTLIREYFYWKGAIVASTNSTAIEYALHEFLFALLTAFEQHGVTKAANGFFMPYGQDASIQELATLFKVDYAPRT